jgi:geranylgeranylglycerol-phosphate geranylgeranyltransferase
LVGFAVVVGATFAVGGSLVNFVEPTLFGFTTGFLICAAAMVINDYYDREIDAINEPSRPIPSGVIRPFEALVVASILTCSGMIIAAFTGVVPNWSCLAVAFIAWTITMLYVTKGKKLGLPGNLMVSCCMVIPLIYGSVIMNATFFSTTIFATMVFLANTGREITKGIVDVKGDRSNNIQTIAVLFGARKASIVAAFFFLLAISITPLPPLLGVVSFWYNPFAVITDFGLTIGSILLILNPSKENARRIKNSELFWFFTGLMAFVAGSFN